MLRFNIYIAINAHMHSVLKEYYSIAKERKLSLTKKSKLSLGKKKTVKAVKDVPEQANMSAF